MKRIKHFSMSIALLLVLVITLGIGTAYAWFTDTKSGSGSVQFGKIEINVTSNGKSISNNTFDKTNLLPGDSILDDDVIAKKTPDSQPFYFRVELSFSVDSSISTYTDTLNSLLTAENIGNGTNFVKDESVTDRAVFYYGTADALTEVTTTDAIVILDKTKFTVPSTLTQLEDYAQFNKTVSLSITVIALQSANMTATVENFKGSNICIYFGSYPQSLKADDVTIDESNVDDNGYYLGSDGERYAKQRVVNLTSYEDDYYQDTCAMTTTANGTKMIVGEEYYFKVEPIKWRVLSTADGAYTLVCDSILSALAYQPNYVMSDDNVYYATDGNGIILKDADDNQVYANNYEYSNLRSWLTGTFYNSAFTSSEKSSIPITEVDIINYADVYARENTKDKVFVLSLSDINNENYGGHYALVGNEEDNVLETYYEYRKGVDCHWTTTDYAKATGVFTLTRESIIAEFREIFEDEEIDEDTKALYEMYMEYLLSRAGTGSAWLCAPTSVGSQDHSLVYTHDALDAITTLCNSDNEGVVPAIRVSI